MILILPVRRTAVVVLAAFVLAIGLSACGKNAGTSSGPAPASASSSTGAALPSDGTASATESGSCKKVRFALHAGLAAGAIHRYLWKPYQAGTFQAGAQGRRAAIVKGALAGAFAFHELKVAESDIRGCPGTQAITSALQSGLTHVGALTAGLKAGNLDPSALTSANGSISSLETKSKEAGTPIKEQEPTPGQLATGSAGE
jgi:hypothetical protein